MLLDLCPKVLPPRNTKILSGFWRAMFYPFGGQMQGGPDWGQVWPAWAVLRYLEATAMLLGAKLGDLEGKLGYREVVFKLSWAILFGHVVAFAFRNALLQQDQDFKWVSASYVGSIGGQSTAILWPRWRHLGANFGDFGTVLKAMGSFWACC